MLLLEDISSQNPANIMPQDCGMDVVLRGSRSDELSLSKSRAASLLCNFCMTIYGHEKKQMLEFFAQCCYSCTVKKNMQRHGSFIHFALLKLTVPGL